MSTSTNLKRKFDKAAFLQRRALSAKKPKQVIHVASAKLKELTETLVEYPLWSKVDHTVAEYRIVKQRGHNTWNPKCTLRGSRGKTLTFTTPVLLVIEEETGPHGNLGKWESTKTLSKAKKTITVGAKDASGNEFMSWVNDVEREHCEAACNMETKDGHCAWEVAIQSRDSEDEVWKDQNKLLKDVIIQKKRKKMIEVRRPATKYAPEGEERPEIPLLYWLYNEDTKTWQQTDTISRLVPGALVQLRCSFRSYCINESMYGVSCDFDKDILVHSMPNATNSTIPVFD